MHRQTPLGAVREFVGLSVLGLGACVVVTGDTLIIWPAGIGLVLLCIWANRSL